MHERGRGEGLFSGLAAASCHHSVRVEVGVMVVVFFVFS